MNLLIYLSDAHVGLHTNFAVLPKAGVQKVKVSVYFNWP